MRRSLAYIALVPCLLAASASGQTSEPSVITRFDQTAVYKSYDLKTIEPAVTGDAWADYDKTLDKRADEVLHDLALADAAQAEHVKTSVVGYYKFLRAWHDQHDPRMQELTKNAAANAGPLAAERQDLATGHQAFLADLASFLAPLQVELVKDRLCYKRPTIMYEGYTKPYPWLTPEQKADIKKICDDARDLAMDGGSSQEKHKIMDKYKGRLTNYIAKAQKAAATQNATPTQPSR